MKIAYDGNGKLTPQYDLVKTITADTASLISGLN